MKSILLYAAMAAIVSLSSAFAQSPVIRCKATGVGYGVTIHGRNATKSTWHCEARCGYLTVSGGMDLCYHSYSLLQPADDKDLETCRSNDRVAKVAALSCYCTDVSSGTGAAAGCSPAGRAKRLSRPKQPEQ
jgi:hypothetical protein